MEFPHLGEHCEEPSCKLLDFLPFKCDSCKKIFCKDHINYYKHNCEKSGDNGKDFQVPLCPLCNSPVPYKRGELPDRAMSAHIDRDCKSDPAEERRRKIYSNKCSLKGCKQKEIIPFTCQKCHRNYCIRHRHETDHECESVSGAVGGASRSTKPDDDIKARRLMFYQNQAAPRSQPQPQPQSRNDSRIQPNSMTESEAIEYAIRLSLNETTTTTTRTDNRAPQNEFETEDEMLARALALSEREHRQQQQQQQSDNDKCTIQ